MNIVQNAPIVLNLLSCLKNEIWVKNNKKYVGMVYLRCNSIIKSGARKGMICNRLKCRIRGHDNIFVYLQDLLGENIFSTIEEKSNKKYDHKKLVSIFEFGKGSFDVRMVGEYVKIIKNIINHIETVQNKIDKIIYVKIMYSLFDTVGFYGLRKFSLKFDMICHSKLEEAIVYHLYDEFNLKNIFETGKKYFSINKNKKDKYNNYLTLFFVKYISPLKDVERNITKFLISV